jgi:hypothetical protein
MQVWALPFIEPDGSHEASAGLQWIRGKISVVAWQRAKEIIEIVVIGDASKTCIYQSLHKEFV